MKKIFYIIGSLKPFFILISMKIPKILLKKNYMKILKKILLNYYKNYLRKVKEKKNLIE